MDITINTTENDILGRKEIIANIQFDKSTPTRKEIKEIISAKIGANPDNTVLREVKSRFGVRSIRAVLHVYPTKETALLFEPKHILIRDGMAEKKQKKEKKKISPPPTKK
ncbi:MAG: 30S ribosomal protein S24e [Candidatus Micrarchaeota archaeon]